MKAGQQRGVSRVVPASFGAAELRIQHGRRFGTLRSVRLLWLQLLAAELGPEHCAHAFAVVVRGIGRGYCRSIPGLSHCAPRGNRLDPHVTNADLTSLLTELS